MGFHDPWNVNFHDLMPHRILEVLLVSSPYDAFTLEEDGRLTERLYFDYSKLNLSLAPRITHAPTGDRAMELLRERRFDMVITMARLPDMDVMTFGRKVKALDPAKPIVLLASTEPELSQFPQGIDPRAVDEVFLWSGDSAILLTMIKVIEDCLNVEPDTRNAGVRVIILVEDSVRRYSSFLILLYRELLSQSQSLIAEGLNAPHKLIRMRARPKVLLATSFEEALEYYRRFKKYTTAVISDVRFPRGGAEDAEAGFKLVRTLREEDPNLTILLQSAEPENEKQAEALKVLYLDKNSDHLRRQIRNFLKEHLGFGEFIFRLSDGTEVAKARSMYEMEQVLRTLPAESLEFHGSRNDFSLWLMARSMFQLARLLRPRKISEFQDLEAVRQHLLSVLGQARIHEQEGVVTDFSSWESGTEWRFVRLGTGSIGGKGRGLAFANSLVARNHLLDRFPGMEILLPRSVVIGSDDFDRFLEKNRHLDGVQRLTDDKKIIRRFLKGRLPDELVRDLKVACKDLTRPLAVRSSSLLEDSHIHPFAGIYATYMLPNNHPDPEVRFREICRAVKAVYASTYSQDSISYIGGTPHLLEEEKMGIVIQEMAGQIRGDRFYPTISGVALSYNYYPVGYQKAEDGIVLLALGLGQTIVLGGAVLQVSPATPGILPQFPSARDFVDYSQTRFYALDMRRREVDFLSGPESNLTLCELKAAEEDGTLAAVGSVYLIDEDRIRENLNLTGPRLVTFNNILKWGSIPLAPALQELLSLFRHGMGCAVEIEFAVEMRDWGRSAPGDRPRRSPSLYILQVRPQSQQIRYGSISTEGYPPEKILCVTDRSLGHGMIEEIRDVVYVKSQGLEPSTTPVVALEIGQVNHRLQEEKAPYLLIGPGRWGTFDPRLGIPVKWAQISGARVIIETDFHDRMVEPSQGTHFFHKITSFKVGYLTLSRGGEAEADHRAFIDLKWLENQPTHQETTHVRHLRFKNPLRAYLDGQHGKAVILK